MRLAALGLLHETNTFAPNTTGPDDFPLMPVGAAQSSILGIITGDQLWNVHAGREDDDGRLPRRRQPAPASRSCRWSSPRPRRAARSTARRSRRCAGHIAAALEAEGPFDGVLMAQHGASVSEEHPDADAEMIRRVRAVGRAAGADRRRRRHPRQHLAGADRSRPRSRSPGRPTRTSTAASAALTCAELIAAHGPRRDRAGPGDREPAARAQHPLPGLGLRSDAHLPGRRPRARARARDAVGQHRRGLPVRRRRAHGHGLRRHRRRRPGARRRRGEAARAARLGDARAECDAVGARARRGDRPGAGRPRSAPGRPARRRRQRRARARRATRRSCSRP